MRGWVFGGTGREGGGAMHVGGVEARKVEGCVRLGYEGTGHSAIDVMPLCCCIVTFRPGPPDTLHSTSLPGCRLLAM